MRTHFQLAAFATLLCVLPLAAKSFEATHYDVRLKLDPQGVLYVTETAEFRFIAGPYTFVFRDLATAETDGIDNVEAMIDGRPCSLGKGPGQVEITGRSPVRVRWHFAPVITGSHTFTVHYRVMGTLRPASNGQLLAWRALPKQKDYHIFSSEVTLEYPPGVQPVSIALRSGAPDFQIGSGQAKAILVNPNADGAIVEARFPAASFAAGTPRWIGEQAEEKAETERNVQISAVGSVIFAAVALFGLIRIRGGASPAPDVPAIHITEPPDSLPPALAGLLTSRGGLSIGTMMDLARRGVLRVEEQARGFLGVRKFHLVLCDANAALSHHEQVLRDAVFPRGENSVTLQEFFKRQAAKGLFAKAVKEDAKALGLLDDARAAVRTRLLVTGAILLAFGAAAMVFHTVAVVIFGVTVLLVGMAALVMGAMQPVWSDVGMVASKHWNAYAKHLAKANAVADVGLVLPYAAAFGVAAPMMKRLRLPLPGWFQAFSSADGADTDAFDSFVAAGDSSSSSDSGSGDGGGASGGGDSGAG